MQRLQTTASDCLTHVSQAVPTDDPLDLIAANLDLNTQIAIDETRQSWLTLALVIVWMLCQIRQRTGCTSVNCSPVAISPLAT